MHADSATPEPPRDYDLGDLDEDGRLRSIRRRDGTLVPIDGSNKDFAAFINWVKKQSKENLPVTLRKLSENHVYFYTESELVDFLKLHSFVIFSDHGRRGACIHSSPETTTILEFSGLPGENIRQIFFNALRCAEVDPDPRNLDAVDGVVPVARPIYIGRQLALQINTSVGQEDSNIRRLSSWPVEKTFVYFDISRFSKYLAGQQAVIINSLTMLLNNASLWPAGLAADALENLDASLCIGDGYIFVFALPWDAAYFAARLACLIERLIAKQRIPEFHFRISIHSGPVYRFWDQCGEGDGRWNYVGKGIIEAERVLSAIGKDKDDIIYISAESRKRIMAKDSDRDPLVPWLQNRGRQADKHGEFRGVCEINHTAWIVEDLDAFVSCIP